jgi:phosphomannomutase
VGDAVRDKDGIGAAVLVAEIASVLRARPKEGPSSGAAARAEPGGAPNQTLLDALDAIARRFGLFVSSQVNLVRKGASGAQEIATLMERLRTLHPERIGDHKVLAVADYASQRRTAQGGAETQLSLPKSNMVAFELEGGSRIIARPSGTEPKVKFYFDVRETVADAESTRVAEERAARTMKALADAFVTLAG